MSSLRYWTGTIGGVALEESAGVAAGFQLKGAEGFVGTFTGQSTSAASGFVHTQYSPKLAGQRIELTFIHIPQALLSSLLTNLSALLPGGGSVACTFADGFQTINKNFKPDVPNWYSRGEPDGSYIKDAVIRLICTG